ncbi:unnamed protein product [Notodromas monacha]|uniref:Nudix hydrolase domain-containing protein n=1 Tax=Notodromas monacha TaxID=399045 RepID=A0A7R9BZJ5_9CRUS|nr:unnamed protein product [Notodromas monacha]CAG0923375.1 unnamed protein product [Notodromas monacha]
MGRTGLGGRGRLGRWGPNHAADPIVTRWARGQDGEKILEPNSELPILEFVAVLRADSDQWAIPGGMVRADEIVSVTLKRRFTEEALDAANMNDKEETRIKLKIARFFSKGLKIYVGYVDDPRNTDNAWMETSAFNFHDDSGDIVGKLNFKPGLDTGSQDVQWRKCSSELKFYASHAQLLQKVCQLQHAHW